MGVLVVRNAHVIEPVDGLGNGAGAAPQPLVKLTLPVDPSAPVQRFVLAEVEPIVHQLLRAAQRVLVLGPLDEGHLFVWKFKDGALLVESLTIVVLECCEKFLF